MDETQEKILGNLDEAIQRFTVGYNKSVTLSAVTLSLPGRVDV